MRRLGLTDCLPRHIHTFSLTGNHEPFTPTLWTSVSQSIKGQAGRRDSEPPLCPQILHLMIAVSFHRPVTQDDPKCHSLGKHQDESPQPLTGMVKVSESHGCGKPRPPLPRQMQAERLVEAGVWAVSGDPGGTGGDKEGL